MIYQMRSCQLLHAEIQGHFAPVEYLKLESLSDGFRTFMGTSYSEADYQSYRSVSHSVCLKNFIAGS